VPGPPFRFFTLRGDVKGNFGAAIINIFARCTCAQGWFKRVDLSQARQNGKLAFWKLAMERKNYSSFQSLLMFLYFILRRQAAVWRRFPR